MLFVGNVVSTDLPEVSEIVTNKNKEALLKLCETHLKNGAEMLGINTSTHMETEEEDLLWLATTIQDAFEVALCLDCLNPKACDTVLRVHRHGRPMLDSLTCEESRMESFLPLMKQYETSGVCLLLSEEGIQEDAAIRASQVEKLLPKLDKYQVKAEDIYLDPMVFSIATNDNSSVSFFETCRLVREKYPQFKLCCGPDNISFGMPLETSINEVFITYCLLHKLDAVLYVPAPGVHTVTKINDMLLGKDEYCLDFIQHFRDNTP